MSFTVVRDHSQEIDRLNANMDNIVRRHCRIGKVTPKAPTIWQVPGGIAAPARPPHEVFFHPPYEPIVTPLTLPVGTWQVMDHPRNCV